MIVLTLLITGAVALPATPAAAGATLCDGKVATILGTRGPDVLSGTAENDVIAGLGGDDRILGGDGDDVVCGGDGADRLFGESGDDKLFAGKAARYDTRAGSGYRPDRLDGGPGDDHLEIGTEPRRLGGVSGEITFGSAPAGVRVDLNQRSAIGDGNDTIIAVPGLRLIGTDAADRLTGTLYDDEILGMGGPDWIAGGDGQDRLYGDADGVEVTDGDNDDTILGGVGKDVVVGTLGADSLDGGQGLDLVRAEGQGASRVRGGVGDDFLYLTLGSEPGVELLGGPGRDDVTIDVHANVPGRGKVLVNLGIAQIALDNVFLGRISSTERLHVGPGVPLSFYGSPGPDEVYVEPGGRLRAWTYGGNDVIWGSDLADRIDGGNGFDEVRAGRGRDTCLHVEQQTGCDLP